MAYGPTSGTASAGEGWQSLGTAALGSTSLAFDPAVDLLWSGDSTGAVASWFPDSLTRYTSCKAHNPQLGPITQLLADEKGLVFSLSANALHCTLRNGLGHWTYRTQNQFDNRAHLTAASFTSARASDLVVSNQSGQLTVVNASTGSALRQIAADPSGAPITQLTHTAHNVVSGSGAGLIAMRDPRTLETTQTMSAHPGGVQGLHGSGHQLYSYGYTMVLGRPVLEPLVRVWDIRSLRPMMPINLPGGPVSLQIHPRLAGTLVIANQASQFQIINTADTSQMSYYNIDTQGAMINCSAISSTGEALAFGDNRGLVHLWSNSPSEPHFSRRSQTIDLPDEAEPVPRIDWNHATPLNLIGMPHYTTSLLSNIPYDHWLTKHTPLFTPRPPLDPDVISNLRLAEFGSYARNPGHIVRNQVSGAAGSRKNDHRKLDVPSFKSQKQRQRMMRSGAGERLEQQEADAKTEQREKDAADQVIKWYRKLHIKYSRFGIEDFDFAYYNQTAYAGLETDVANSYINSLLQLFSATQPLRRIARAHTLEDCPKENCLLCEFGFLTQMLQDAQGANCQASNFSKAFSSLPATAASELIDSDGMQPGSSSSASGASYASMIQAANQFLIYQMSAESSLTPSTSRSPLSSASYSTTPDSGSAVEDLFGLRLRTQSACLNCGASTYRDSKKHVIDMMYPQKPLSNEAPPPSDFLSIIRGSIVRESKSKTMCASCRRASQIRVRRQFTTTASNEGSPVGATLPPVLSFNTGIRTVAHLDIWQDSLTPGRQRFLLPSFAIAQDQAEVTLLKESTSPSHVQYQLKGMVLQIQAEGEPAHLVALIDMRASHQDAPAWHLFNDFLVRPVSTEEALSFTGSWKIPSVLLYTRVDTAQCLDLSSLPQLADPSILCQDISISQHRDPDRMAHVLLKDDELPAKGTLVAIDAEFVSLQQEEVEIHSDGHRKLIRPAKMCLARVSVLRGQGPLSGVPFIDDHIHTSQPIVDYLTEFSGIMPGDLDVDKSPHTLVPLKTAYKKLRMLVDRGCVFVGHGLASDFRIINIHVPASQIIDTVSIYYLPERQRKLSLRLLAWVVLNQDVQSAGTHDSIEDARTALSLYQEHEKMVAEGVWEDELEELFRTGKQLNWKVPGHSQPPPKPDIAPEVQVAQQ